MTPTDDQIERVARAIYEAASGPWDHASDYGQDIVRREARAAIAALQPQVLPELIEKLSRLANYLTAQGEYEACDLIDTVVERVAKPAAVSPQEDGLAELRALSEKATPGPWKLNGDISEVGDEAGTQFIIGENLGGLVGGAMAWSTELDSGDFSRVIANALLITAAVNHVRAEIERAKP